MKKVWMLMLVLVLLGTLFLLWTQAAVTITHVVAEQPASPLGSVMITYTVSGKLPADASGYLLMVTAIDQVTGRTYAAQTLSGDTALTLGEHQVWWNMSADGYTLESQRGTFTVAYYLPLFCVIHLSSGASSSSYPVTYLGAVPSGGWTDAYKTTNLVLRLLPAGTYKMQNNQNVTLMKPFYMGVFELTQKQYSLVTGWHPSQYTGDTRPVEAVSYNAIRGSSAGAGWPASSTVDASSFMGKLRARTGLDFDLPTEAQWEYACRAGTTTTYCNGDTENDLKQVGRYRTNGGLSSQHAIVGSYQPNAWGLYDMHGNVWEYCLDWSGTLTYGTDPKGVGSGSDRVVRGGSWSFNAVSCASSNRSLILPSIRFYDHGFRLSRTLP